MAADDALDLEGLTMLDFLEHVSDPRCIEQQIKEIRDKYPDGDDGWKDELNRVFGLSSKSDHGLAHINMCIYAHACPVRDCGSSHLMGRFYDRMRQLFHCDTDEDAAAAWDAYGKYNDTVARILVDDAIARHDSDTLPVVLKPMYDALYLTYKGG